MFNHTEASFDGAIETAKPFGLELVQFIAVKVADLLKKLSPKSPTAQNVRFFIEAYSIPNTKMQNLSLNKLHEFVCAQQHNEEQMSEPIAEAIMRVFTDVLGKGLNSSDSQHSVCALLPLQCLEILTANSTIDEYGGEGPTPVDKRLPKILLQFLEPSAYFYTEALKQLCGLQLILEIIKNLCSDDQEDGLIQKFMSERPLTDYLPYL